MIAIRTIGNWIRVGLDGCFPKVWQNFFYKGMHFAHWFGLVDLMWRGRIFSMAGRLSHLVAIQLNGLRFLDFWNFNLAFIFGRLFCLGDGNRPWVRLSRFRGIAIFQFSDFVKQNKRISEKEISNYSANSLTCVEIQSLSLVVIRKILRQMMNFVWNKNQPVFHSQCVHYIFYKMGNL